jgi:putative Mn2+ efflux pump MntP
LSFVTIVFIALGLSMDAFAVSITTGMMPIKARTRYALKVGFFFGLAQAIMPIIGWFASINFHKYISRFGHWAAFLLLCFIGGKMIYESLKERTQDCYEHGLKKKKTMDNKTLFLLAIATSLDALAVGVSFAFLDLSILRSSIVIGLITLVICFAGVLIGRKCSSFLRSRAELLGGIGLIYLFAFFISLLKYSFSSSVSVNSANLITEV